MAKERKPALRRCTGCREMFDKRSLARIVWNGAALTLMHDETGKAQGRGAYICKNADCLTKAAAAHGLEKSFRCAEIPKEAYKEVYKILETRQ